MARKRKCSESSSRSHKDAKRARKDATATLSKRAKQRLIKLLKEPFFKECRMVETDPDFIEYTNHTNSPKVFEQDNSSLCKNVVDKYLISPDSTDDEESDNDAPSPKKRQKKLKYPDWCLAPRN